MSGALEVSVLVVIGGICGYLFKRLNALWEYAEKLELELGIHIENTIAEEVETALDEIREVLGDSGAASLDPFDMLELQKQQMIAGAFGRIAEYIGNRLNAPMGVHSIEAPQPIQVEPKGDDL
jgi:sugar phosphate isomerase/epimerase